MSVAEQVMSGLKEFQVRSVENAFSRLYETPGSTGRFLVADEVGLGKTMVARGVIAKAIDHLREKGVGRIDVIYVCSNQVVARQNISKLMVTGSEHDPILDRVTMLPAHLHDLAAHEVNLIPLTPQTSLDLRSNVGARRERALLWQILCEVFGTQYMLRTGPRRALQGSCRTLESFDEGRRYDALQWQERGLDEDLVGSFLELLSADRQSRCDESMLVRFESVAEGMTRKRHDHLAPLANRLVGEFRSALAKSSIDALEPDLVILDEFQRFRNLISPDDPTGELARLLFDSNEAKVLMLSATPYRMLTQDAEADEDHHSDFLRTIDFLNGHDSQRTAECRRQLKELRKGLRGLPDSYDQAMPTKVGLESSLRSVMSRVERLAVGNDRNGMVAERSCPDLRLVESDLEGFVQLDRVARAIGHPDTVEYWKSSPYPLNFMDDYKLVRLFEEQAPTNREARPQGGTLPTESVSSFDEVDLGNPRLRSLCADTVGKGYWKLLWLPPSLPYYRPGKPFDEIEGEQPTKRLVFSAWNVVPKAVACLLSYEAERHIETLSDKRRRNTPEARKSLSQPLRFATRSTSVGDEPATMTTLALVMPSIELSKLGDPLGFLRTSDSADPMSSESLLEVIEERVARRLESVLGEREPSRSAQDPAWYVVAPLLLDSQSLGQDDVLSWLESEEVKAVVGARDAVDGETIGAASWRLHIDSVVDALGGGKLGPVPEDLVRVLAMIALASPANAAFRALGRIAPQADHALLRLEALRVAEAMRGMFNWTEVAPLVRATHKTSSYWKDTLHYCVNGNLQAVLDEYAHVLSEWAPIPGEKGPNDSAHGVSEAMQDALALQASDYQVRAISDEGTPMDETLSIRPRFAVRFADPKASDEKQAIRASNVRASFNSPFWPFVLASTSVGQEGLDFHLYCHAIVHWNLPSNPVDFEQREGRVHRYKGHAVRKNAAQRFVDAIEAGGADPWEQMFDKPGDSDAGLTPYWVLEGDAKILRFVPALPCSQDSERQLRLEKLMASYRLAFGQPRQDDLLSYLGSLDLDPTMVHDLTISLAPS